jgi:hypothetical protein
MDLKAQDRSMTEKDTQLEGIDVKQRVVSEVRTLQHWYSAEFERRLSELTQVLNAQLEVRVEEIRAHYAAQVKAPKQVENGSAQHVEPAGAILDEIARSEASAQKFTAELERMVSDDNVALGKLLQMRSQEMEIRAYIRGLKYRAEAGTPSAQPVETTK